MLDYFPMRFPKTTFLSDADIIETIDQCKRLEPVFRFLVREYQPMIRRMVLKNRGQTEDVDDVFQEGVIRLVEAVKKGSFSRKCSLKTFFYAICRNIWLDSLRKKKTFLLHDLTEDQLLSLESADGLTLFPEAELNIKKAMDQVFAELGDPCRSILEGFYYESLSITELVPRYKGQFSTEQSLRNKKSSCMRLVRRIIARHPDLEQLLREQLGFVHA